MGSSERLCLRWNDFESNIKHGFSELREEEDFFDVTLACGSKQIKAHKVILSACSPFFRSIIKSVPHQHPLLYLRGIKFSHLESLLCFMYNGEVNVTQEELNNFLAVAEELKIKGLTQSHSGSGSPLPHETGGGPPPSKRPRLLGKSSSPTPRINNSTGALGGSSGSLSSSGPQGATSSAGNGSRGRHAGQLSNHPSGSSSSSRGGGNILQEEDDDIQDITASVVKSEPKEPPSGNTMVVTPDVSLAHEELGEDPYAQEEDNYEDYAQYGSDSGEINYAEGGAIMDPGLAAVPGPSGATAAADGNKGGGGGGEAILALDSAINRLIIRNASGFTCKKCGKTSSQRTCLRNHIEAKHIQTDGFRCTLCSRVFKTRNSLSVHTSTKHTNATPYISGTRELEQAHRQQQQQQQQQHEEVYDV